VIKNFVVIKKFIAPWPHRAVAGHPTRTSPVEVVQDIRVTRTEPPIRLTVADAGEVLTLQRAAYVTEAQLHDDVRLPPLTQTMDELCEELTDPAITALGLREHGRLVACVRLHALGAGRVALGRLAVAPDRQGAGLGTRLLWESERAVPGTTTIELFTGELSAANLRLYQRLGYVETHRSPAGGHELVYLGKAVTGHGTAATPLDAVPPSRSSASRSAVQVVASPPVPDDVERLLAALPDWFGIPESTAEYVEAARRMPTLVARPADPPSCTGVDASVVGILLLDQHVVETVEIHLMAVDPAWHRRGVGRALVESAAATARASGARLLEVKALGPSTDHEPYHRTREFYAALGFLPVEELHGLWNDGNSCLLLVRPL
jgi:GNAT superfamily N-acetyltransferase